MLHIDVALFGYHRCCILSLPTLLCLTEGGCISVLLPFAGR